MAISGTNGFVNIIAGIYALRAGVDEQEWAHCLRDLDWVLAEVLKSKKAHRQVSSTLKASVYDIYSPCSNKRTPEAEQDESNGRSKRARR